MRACVRACHAHMQMTKLSVCVFCLGCTGYQDVLYFVYIYIFVCICICILYHLEHVQFFLVRMVLFSIFCFILLLVYVFLLLLFCMVLSKGQSGRENK